MNLAWRQLVREKRRFATALAGIAFAVLLMLMQMGFEDALYRSATGFHRRLRCDLAVVSRQYTYFRASGSMARRRLTQALAVDGVRAVAPLYIGMGIWKNPETRREYTIAGFAFDPEAPAFDLPEVDAALPRLRVDDAILFDSASRPEFGPVPELLRRHGSVATEVNGRRVRVVGLFPMGASFSANGNFLTSDLNFTQIFPGRKTGVCNIGLVTLDPGRDPLRVRDEIARALPDDVRVLTRDEFIRMEEAFWRTNTPIGYIFGLGVFMGVIVGGVVVYQILYSDVSDHLAEYATLKAMGYSDRTLGGIVLHQALIMSILGFLPGWGFSLLLYQATRDATQLPMMMTPGRVAAVLGMTVAMCAAAAFIAMNKVRTADPAEVF